MSRTALLDLILMFWVLLAFAALVLDRDHARRRLAERADDFRGSRLGRGQGIRWLRVAAGFCLGCACATKWSGLWFLVAFGLLTVAWDAGARRAVGVRWPTTGAFARDATPAFASIVPIALVTYVASWAGWFHSKNAWDRQWATGKASDWSWIPAPLRSLWHYHTEMYSFHTHLTTPHSYQSNPWGWLILARPVSFFYQGTKNGDPGCHVASCSQEVLALGTPLIWWAAFLSLFVCLWLVLAKKDWRANAALIGIAAGWLPWIHYSERTIFQFYSVAFVPFLVIALTLVLGLILGPANATARRRTIGSVLVGAYLLLAFADFVSLWPLYTGQVLPYDDWYRRLLHIRAWI
jgi:dolichyl-phosphate-mannose--protein O-mannosyl transferase